VNNRAIILFTIENGTQLRNIHFESRSRAKKSAHREGRNIDSYWLR